MTVKKSTKLNKENLITLISAILIVALIVFGLFVIYILFFSQTVPGAGYVCFPSSSSYFCAVLPRNSTAGNVSVYIKQTTGENWINVYVVITVNNTEPNQSLFKRPTAAYVDSLQSGQGALVSFHLSPQRAKVIGNIWAKYNLTDNSVHYIEIGSSGTTAS